MANNRHSWELLQPNKNYAIKNSKYTFPNIECHGLIYLLLDIQIENARNLLNLTSNLLKSLSVEWFLTKGALLGAIRHKTIPLPFDEYICIGVNDKYRKLLFSRNFVDEAENFGIEVLYAKNNSSLRANNFGACVRLQIPNILCILDIVFWKFLETTNQIVKLDGWSPPANLVLNPNLQLSFDDIYPIQTNMKIDNMFVNVPKTPLIMLEKQYGQEVMQKCIARSLAVSHICRGVMLKPLWTRFAPG